jgi:hypothetical protein
MAYFMFVDESGQDHRESPYEVLAGVAVHDTRLWDLTQAIKQAERRCFGVPYTTGGDRELKATNLLTRKTFRLARQLPAFPVPECAGLAREILRDGMTPSKARLTALGQAKLAFVGRVLDLTYAYDARAFASIVKPDAPQRGSRDFLRKDYSYLFQRFYNFVEGQPAHERGVVVFDELDKSQSHILLGQMSAYFLGTRTGRQRSSRIVPEPFFVHSDLTTGILLADLVAYILSHNVRLARMTNPKRDELDELGDKVKRLRPWPTQQGRYSIRAFAFIEDLRTREERGLEWPPSER